MTAGISVWLDQSGDYADSQAKTDLRDHFKHKIWRKECVVGGRDNRQPRIETGC